MLLPLVCLKHDRDFAWGVEQREAFERIKNYLARPPVLRVPRTEGSREGICGGLCK
jgi:hypothetical protein